MLYDPKWDVQTTTKPILRGFIKWLKTKDADAHYDWKDTSKCAVAQFYRECVECTPDWIATNREVRAREGVDINVLAALDEWTYGALLQRAEAAL